MLNDHTNRVRARHIAQLAGHPLANNYMTSHWRLEYRPAEATFVFAWGGADGTVHEHVFETLATWHNVYEPGYISDEELALLRVKVKLTTC